MKPMTEPSETQPIYEETAEAASLSSLGGRTVGVLQTRHQTEFAPLIERHGGRPLLAPALREVPAEDRAALDRDPNLVAALTLEAYQAAIAAFSAKSGSNVTGVGRAA